MAEPEDGLDPYELGIDPNEMVRRRTIKLEIEEVRKELARKQLAELTGMTVMGLFGMPWFAEAGPWPEEQAADRRSLYQAEDAADKAYKTLEEVKLVDGRVDVIEKAELKAQRAAKQLAKIESDPEVRYQAMQCMDSYDLISPEEHRWFLRQSHRRDTIYVATALRLATGLSPAEVVRVTDQCISEWAPSLRKKNSAMLHTWCDEFVEGKDLGRVVVSHAKLLQREFVQKH